MQPVYTSKMKTIPISASDNEIKQVVRDWLAVLADENYDLAVEMMAPEIPEGSGSVNTKQFASWTPELLRDVINNYGIPEPIKGQEQVYKVVPIDPSFREIF